MSMSRLGVGLEPPSKNLTKSGTDTSGGASATEDIRVLWCCGEASALAFGLSMRPDLSAVLSRCGKDPLCLRSLCSPEGEAPLCVGLPPLRDKWGLPVVLVDFPSGELSLAGFLLMIALR